MKRLVLIISIVSAMVLALTACGGGSSSNQPTGTVSEVTQAAGQTTEAAPETEAATEAEVTTEAAETEAAETEAAGTEAAETEAAETTTEAASDEDFAVGTVSGLVYENEYLKIGCKLPEGWTTYSDEEMAQINDIVAQTNEDALKQLEKQGYIYDLMAGEESGNNINIIVQNLNVIQSLALANNMEESLKSAEADLISALEGMGAENVEFKIDRSQTFPVDDYACGVVSGNIMGIDMYERLVLFKVDNYLANVTAAAFGEDITADIIGSFYALD